MTIVETTEPGHKLAYSVEEAGQMIGLCRRTVYELLSSGQLRSVKVGRRRLERHVDLVDFLAGLEAAASAVGGPGARARFFGTVTAGSLGLIFPSGLMGSGGGESAELARSPRLSLP